jgi:hypothetical protein
MRRATTYALLASAIMRATMNKPTCLECGERPATSFTLCARCRIKVSAGAPDQMTWLAAGPAARPTPFTQDPERERAGLEAETSEAELEA